MRWERLFGELEGHAEHARLAERDALVTELRDGEWATRSWLDGLQGDPDDVELCLRDAGLLAGRVLLANRQVVHLQSPAADHYVCPSEVLWMRGGSRSPGIDASSVTSRLGWGHVLRDLQERVDEVAMALVGGETVDGTVTAVGSDFVRVASAQGRERNVPFTALAKVTVPRSA